MHISYKTIGYIVMLGVVLAGVLVFLTSRGVEHTVAVSEREGGGAEQDARAPTYLATSTLPLRVSGMVEAADQAIVYAQTAGVVTALPVREGGVVTQGQVLAVQATPVADAERALAEASGVLTALEQEQARAARTTEAAQAGVRAYTAREVAALRAANNEARLQETGTALFTALEANVLTLTEAADFVNTHRGLFGTDEREAYDAAVATLYGGVPNYLRGSAAVPRAVGGGLDSALDTLRGEEPLDVLLLGQVAGVVEEVLMTLYDAVFVPAEEQVLDPVLRVDDDIRAAFDAQRVALITARDSLNAARAAFNTQADARVLDAATQDSTVVVTELDEEIATQYAAQALRIEVQSREVVAAREALAAAVQGLGRTVAPFMGSVSKVLVEEGEYVTPGTPLLELVGSGAHEVTVSVPAFAAIGLAPGAQFRASTGRVLGTVERVGSVQTGGSIAVVIALRPEAGAVGSSIVGTLAVAYKELYVLSRSMVHFDADGAYVVYDDGTVSRATVRYDDGATLYAHIEVPQSDRALVPANSITL